MDPSLLALAALVLIPAIQVPAVLYVARYVEVDADELPDLPSGYTSPPTEWGLDGSDDPEEGPVSVPDRVACARCGVENDAAFVYCRACTARLT
jgi:hypothetical protein